MHKVHTLFSGKEKFSIIKSTIIGLQGPLNKFLLMLNDAESQDLADTTFSGLADVLIDSVPNYSYQFSRNALLDEAVAQGILVKDSEGVYFTNEDAE